MHRAPTKPATATSKIVEALLRPAAFDHAVTKVELVETHISWVVLTDQYAYKIKKPVVLDFLDFGTLERRAHFCRRELELNKPWAEELYVDVVPITLIDGQPHVGGEGDAIEYAVRMRRFDQVLRLDHQLAAGKLSVRDMKELGSTIAARHAAAPRIDADRRGRVLRLTGQFMRDNFAALKNEVDAGLIDPLDTWTGQQLARCRDTLASRFDAGFVRDCHGDLHLGNLVRLADGITTFDCIEFNDDLRHIDTMCDVAFLVMDLAARGRSDLSAHFLNRYLESTGDYGGVSVLNLFFVYRCLVRAKVAVIRSKEQEDAKRAAEDRCEAVFYCELALRRIRHDRPQLVVMHGLSGAGKTWVAAELMAALPAVRLRSDIERKRIFGLAETASSHSRPGEGMYTAAANDAVYARLYALARQMLDARQSVILDAAFLDPVRRSEALLVAQEAHAPAVILDVQAPVQELRDRLRRRGRQGSDASEANLAILEWQLQNATALSPTEQARTVACDTMLPLDADALVGRIRSLARSNAAGHAADKGTGSAPCSS